MLALVVPGSGYAQQASAKDRYRTTQENNERIVGSRSADVLATPQSIAQAQARIEASQYLSAPDKVALDAFVAQRGLIVYGAKDTRLEIPAAAQGASQKYITCLVGLADASSGEIPRIFQNAVCSTMSEFISSLTFFRSSRNETRDQALAALGRFEALGSVSVVPMLIKGRLRLNRNNMAIARKFPAGART